MSHTSPLVTHLAHRYAAWLDQATRCHQALRALSLGAQVQDFGDGTVTVRIDVATWRAAVAEADAPAPEPAASEPAS